ncbi:MAG TPA: PAS domain S-box protein [Lacunisphaera sp.]|jgi:PAS domain S-box-containing protein|nr:PAS domain S-box protein [Lacunisphaera sp.]
MSKSHPAATKAKARAVPPVDAADAASPGPSPASHGMGLWDLDLITGELTWSEALCAIHGLAYEARPRNAADASALVHPGDRERVTAALRRAMETGQPCEIEYRALRADQKPIWLLTNAAVLRRDGRAVRLAGASLDVTLRQGDNEAAQRLAAIVESSNDAIISKTPEGIVTSWNAAAARLFGYSADEMIGRSIIVVIPADRHGEEADILSRIRRGEQIENYETVRRRKDGRLIDVALTISPIKDAQGRITGASKIAHDITLRKRTEAALRASEERFRLLASQAPAGIFLSDRGGGCMFVNERWCELTGLAPGSAQGDGWTGALHPEDRDRVIRDWQEAVRSGAGSTTEFRFLRPDGSTVWVQGSAVLFSDGDRLQGYLGTCVDITQRKHAELRAAFLHQVTNQLAELDTAPRLMTATAIALGRQFTADRVFCLEVEENQEAVTVATEWRRPGLAPLPAGIPFAQLGSRAWRERLSRPRQAFPSPADPAAPAGAPGPGLHSIQSLASSGWSQAGRWAFTLAVAFDRPREWTADELELIENVASRLNSQLERVRATKVLRESEQLYRAIGESIKYGVWVCDATGRNIYASDSFLNLVGMTQQQCSGEGWTSLLPPEEVEATKAAWQECVRSGKFWEREHRIKGVDGAWHPVLARGLPIRDDQGHIVRWVGLNLDISDIKQAENTSRRRLAVLERLNRVGNQLVAERELDKIVQLVTDTGREISGAAYGAFFQRAPGDREESLKLQAFSGAPPAKFDDLLGPRVTELTGPTLRGEGPVRIADLHQEPSHPPHQELPSGQVPIRSYLAVPVVSRGGDVLGGLFFGHPEPAVFTEEAETVVVALAAQAAIAIDNAKLYAALELELEEQRRAEGRLRDSEARWRQLAEAMPHLVWSATADGTCDFLSPQWVAYTGEQDVDLLGDGWLEVVHSDDRDRVQNTWQQALASGGVYSLEFRLRRADGQFRWFKVRAVPIRDPLGQIVKWYGSNTDIEEFRRAELAAREGAQQLRLVTDHAPIFLAQLGRDRRFKFVNQPYAERYHRSREDIVGRHIEELTGTEAYEAIRHHLDLALSGRRVEFEQEVPYETLGRRWVHIIYEPERSPDGEVAGLVAVIVDVTARKEAELEIARARDEALTASRAKDDFLAALSHELRTPLSPVLLLASDAASNANLPAEVRQMFETIHGNVSLEARLIDDLLDLTRIARDKMPLEQAPVDLHAVLKDAAGNLRPEIEAKTLELDLQLAARDTTALGDAVRLQQVFWNILRNAVKFTPPRGRIRVATRNAGDAIVVEVADSGIGMTAAELERAFEAFKQGDHAANAGSHRFGGLGLGLTISRKLVELHAGRVQADSAGRNRGSTITVELPLAADAHGGVVRGRGRPEGSRSPAPERDGPARSILLVEDHAATREAMARLLSRRNYEVVAVGTATDARDRAADRTFDFLISDVGLPDGNGYDLMADLRRHQPGLKGVAVSGFGMEDDMQRSRAAGFLVHLVKPVSIGALERALTQEQPASAAS